MFIFFFTAHLIVCERGFTVGRSEDTNFVPQCISIFCFLFLKSWGVIFFLSNSGIVIFGEYYLNFSNRNQQKDTRLHSSCHKKRKNAKELFRKYSCTVNPDTVRYNIRNGL